MQAQQLQAPATSVPGQQLDQWTREAAAIRRGQLLRILELANVDALGDGSALSPPGDQVAIAFVSGSVLPAPIPRAPAHVDGLRVMSEDAQALPVPASQPGLAAHQPASAVLCCQWCPSGEALVVVRACTASAQDLAWRITTCLGTEPFGSWAERLACRTRLHSLPVAAGASQFWLVLYDGSSDVVLACTPQGMAGRHAVAVPTWSWAPSQDGSCLLAASPEAKGLLMCTAAAGLQVRSLGSPLHDIPHGGRTSLCKWGSLAVVRHSSAEAGLLSWADMRQWRLLHAERWARDGLGGVPALGRRSMAPPVHHANRSHSHDWPFSEKGILRVLATAGAGMGRQLFACDGLQPNFESMPGVQLAIKPPGGCGRAARHIWCPAGKTECCGSTGSLAVVPPLAARLVWPYISGACKQPPVCAEICWHAQLTARRTLDTAVKLGCTPDARVSLLGAALQCIASILIEALNCQRHHQSLSHNAHCLSGSVAAAPCAQADDRPKSRLASPGMHAPAQMPILAPSRHTKSPRLRRPWRPGARRQRLLPPASSRASP